MTQANQEILNKIKRLLSLAEDGGRDEESQTALLMAQKLMLKHKISQQELAKGPKQEIVLKSLSIYKRLYWWEKVLATIIADNFRCLFYIQSNRLPYQATIQRKIVLMGYPEDVELAYEMFYLAAQSMKYYAKRHLDQTPAKQTAHKRKSYYLGFLDGLKDKFDSQRQAMSQESAQYALMIQTPQAVQDRFNREITGSLAFDQPVMNQPDLAYQDGYQKGKGLDLATKRIDQPH